MISVGDYYLIMYNVFGTKLRHRRLTAINYTRALVFGHRIVKWVDNNADKKHRPASFTIDRRLFNSLDKHDNW